MKVTLAMLAVTAMKTGVCIAGVRPDAPATWMRPVREFGSVLLGDITYPPSGGSSPSAPRRVMRPFDLVDLTLGHARPDPPHVEDWTCDFAHSRPRLVGTLPEERRAALLDGAASTVDEVWRRHTRSLATLRVDQFSAIFTSDAYTGKYEARVAFPGLPPDVSSVPCTDLKWRAFGRRLLAGAASLLEGDTRTLVLAGAELDAALDATAGSRDRASAGQLGSTGRAYWIAMGLARAYNGQHWPLVVGVHTLPDYEVDIDYTAL
jgi:hypothetical protein